MNKKLSILIVLAMVVISFSTIAIGETNNGKSADTGKPADVGKTFLNGKSTTEIANKISQMSFRPMIAFAKKFGIATIKGKDISKEGNSKGAGSPKNLQDRPVGADPLNNENEPSIAVKPNSSSTVVAASHFYPGSNSCVAYRSTNSGETWAKAFLPLLPISGDWCSDPIVRWAPDGSKVYAAYMSIRSDLSSADVVVSKSTDNGLTWSAPVIAIAGSTTKFPDKPWLDVHTFWPGTSTNYKVYVTSTLFNSDDSIDIGFSRSINNGSAFPNSGTPLLVASELATGAVLQGSRPIGGKSYSSSSGDVLVCWYNSDADGWLAGSFSERCKRSGNYGSTFGSEVIAFDSTPYSLFELPYYLGPFSQNYRWWGGMFPSMIISYDGTANMVFTADPVSGSADSEDGDIYYIKSVGAPYDVWTRPTKLNDDWYKSQGFPTITSKRVSGGSVIVASWMDTRNSPWYGTVPGVYCGTYSDNCLYDIYSAKTDPSWTSQPNQRLTDVSSVSDYGFVGDYIDSSVSGSTSDKRAHVIWTDRSDKLSIFDYEDDVYSDTATVNG